MTEAVHAVVDSIVIVGVLICWALIHYVYDLKVVKTNVQRSLSRALMVYDVELGPYAVEATKNIFCVKGEEAVSLPEFRSSYKNLDDHVMSGRPKTVDSKAVLQATEAKSIR